MADLIDSYNESNSAMDWGIYPGNGTALAQSFTNTSKSDISSCKFYIKRTGTLTGNVVAKLYAHTGTYGGGGVPTGSALATSDTITASSISTSYSLVEFTFSTSYEMQADTKYCICIEHAGTNSSNCIYAGVDSSSSSHSGNFAYYFNTYWENASSWDMCFYVYGNPSTPPFIPKVLMF